MAFKGLSPFASSGILLPLLSCVYVPVYVRHACVHDACAGVCVHACMRMRVGVVACMRGYRVQGIDFRLCVARAYIHI